MRRPPRPYLQQVHLRHALPLLDVHADFLPGLNIIVGEPGTGKSSFLWLLEELASRRTEKYAGAGSTLHLSGAPARTITFHEADTSPEYRKKLLAERELSREALDQLFPRPSRQGQQPLHVRVASRNKVVTDRSLAWALQELSPKYPCYELVALGPDLPPAHLPLVADALTLTLSAEGNVTSDLSAPQERLSYFTQALLTTVEQPFPVSPATLPAGELLARHFRRFVQQGIGVHLDRLNAYLPLYSPMQAVRLREPHVRAVAANSREVVLEQVVLEYQLGGEWLGFAELPDPAKRLFYLLSESLTASFAYPVQQGAQFRCYDSAKILLLDEPLRGLSAPQQQQALHFLHGIAQQHQIILTTDQAHVLALLSGQPDVGVHRCDFAPRRGTHLHPLALAQQLPAR